MEKNKGINNSNYKDGRCSKDHYCKNSNCEKKISLSNWYYGSGLCGSCAQLKRSKNPEQLEIRSLAMKGKNNPMFGTHRAGKDNPNYKDGRKNKKHFCKECNINQITYNTAVFGTGICGSCSHKGEKNWNFGTPAPHGKKIKYKGISMRSSWETKYAKYLDEKNIKWNYEPKRFNLGNMTYTPDFYLPKTNTYIEIKGYWRDNGKQRFFKFKKLNPDLNIKLLMGDDLKSLGIKI